MTNKNIQYWVTNEAHINWHQFGIEYEEFEKLDWAAQSEILRQYLCVDGEVTDWLFRDTKIRGIND